MLGGRTDDTTPLHGTPSDGASGWHKTRFTRAAIGCSCLTALILAAVAFSTFWASASTPVITLSVSRMMATLSQFERIASEHSGSRSIARGFNASSAFVQSQIAENTAFHANRQLFHVQISEELSPATLEQLSPVPAVFIVGTDFAMMGSSGPTPAGGITANIAVAKQEGCVSSDFDSVTSGSVALIMRGNCSFATKVAHAVEKGAAAVIVYNTPDEQGLFSGRACDAPCAIAVLAVSHSQGVEWAAAAAGAAAATLRLSTSVRVSDEVTSNLEVDTGAGDIKNTITIGAHLDSVPEGPGINDNGSGSALVLELAMELSRILTDVIDKSQVTNRTGWHNRIVLCFWGAEEIGLKGSKHWVQDAKKSGRLSNVALNLNFDMLASPNYMMGVYDGSTAPPGPDVLNGSVAIQNLLVEAIIGGKNNVSLREFNGRSDYGSFIAEGIPAGGIGTGNADIKTPAARTKFGGIANAAYDPCYHQSCDTVENINQEGYKIAADAIASVVVELAMKPNLRQWLQLKGDRPTYAPGSLDL